MGARKRMIDPGIWTDSGFLELSYPARLLFIGLISQADDEGRGSASDKAIKAKTFPADECSMEDIATWKAEVALHMSVNFYDVGGEAYYRMERWQDHQSIDKAKKSHIPVPQEEQQDTGEASKEEKRKFAEELKRLAKAKTTGGLNEVRRTSGRGKTTSNSDPGRKEATSAVA